MENKSIKELKNHSIIEFCHYTGIADIGFINNKPLLSYADFISKRNKKDSCYLENGYDKLELINYDPKVVFEKTRSIIVLFFPYDLKMQKNNRFNKFEAEIQKYKISLASIFEDYHTLVNRQLIAIEQFIKETYHKESKVYCDTGPLNDRALALKTNKVKLGQHGMLIHPKYGTRFYIGYILTELELDTSDSIDEITQIEAFYHPFCATCGRCVVNCPNQAIKGYEDFNSNRCISFLTQSKEWKESLNELSEKDLTLDGYIYGCDTCQQVCPLNGIPLDQYRHKSIIPNTYVETDIMNLSNREHNLKFGSSSAGWIGNRRFKRNLLWNKNHSAYNTRRK